MYIKNLYGNQRKYRSRFNLGRILFTGALLAFLGACSPAGFATEAPALETREPEAMLAETATSPPPTNTTEPSPTSSPTDAPTETMTPEPEPTATQELPTPTEVSQADIYYPVEDNQGWWYYAMWNGTPLDIWGFHVADFENGAQGTTIRIEDTGVATFLGESTPNLFEEFVNETGVYRTMEQFWITPHVQGEMEYDPPLPVLLFPVESGKTWTYEDMYQFEMNIVDKVSVQAGNFFKCIEVTRESLSIQEKMVEIYCPGRGRVAFDHTIMGRDYYMQLWRTTTANADLFLIEPHEEHCDLYIHAAGFRSSESLTLTVITAEFEFVGEENLPYNFQTIYPIHPWDPEGLWLFLIEGQNNSAILRYVWEGDCS